MKKLRLFIYTALFSLGLLVPLLSQAVETLEVNSCGGEYYVY